MLFALYEITGMVYVTSVFCILYKLHANNRFLIGQLGKGSQILLENLHIEVFKDADLSGNVAFA